jgi:hypothetical protein
MSFFSKLFMYHSLLPEVNIISGKNRETVRKKYYFISKCVIRIVKTKKTVPFFFLTLEIKYVKYN